VEVISGKPFDEFLRERIFKPLKMSDTDFYVPNGYRNQLSLYQKAGNLSPRSRKDAKAAKLKA
jgi:CubicO group peptidase (beta-lactamase class C family)